MSNAVQLLVENPQRSIIHQPYKGKPLTVYLTMNGIYNSPNHKVRTQLFNAGKMALLVAGAHQLPKMEPPIKISLLFKDTTKSDLDNVSFFWFKCLADLMKKHNKISDDNSSFITGLSAQFEPGERSLLFTFESTE